MSISGAAALAPLAASNPSAVMAIAGGGAGVTGAATGAFRAAETFTSNKFENVRHHGIAGLCRSYDGADFEEAEEERSEPSRYRLRMCVHSGKSIQSLRGGSCRSKVKVVVAEGQGPPNEEILDSLPTVASQNPVWEFAFTREVQFPFSGRPPHVSIKIFESSGWSSDGVALLGLGGCLGETEIDLPREPQAWPQVENLKLSLPSRSEALLDPNQMPTVKVVWELVDLTDEVMWDRRRDIPLTAMAELDMAAGGDDIPQTYSVDAKLYEVTIEQSLRAVQEEGATLEAEMDIVHRRDDSAVLTHKPRSTRDEAEEPGNWTLSNSELSEHGPFQRGGFEKFVWQTATEGGKPRPSVWHPDSWTLTERMIHLPGYHLKVSVFIVSPDGKKRIFAGSWEDRMDILMDRAKTDGVEKFAAYLRRPETGTQIVGELHMSVDVFSLSPNKPRDSIDDTMMVRGGWLNSGSTFHETDFYFTIFGDQFLVAEDQKDVRPFIKVILGDTVKEEDLNRSTIKLLQADCKPAVTFWKEMIHVSASPDERQVRVQVWNRSSDLFGGEDKLVCEAFLADMVVDSQLYWRHCYAGSLGSPMPFKCLLMSRNLIHPSTYRGTMAISVSSLPPVNEQIRTRIHEEYACFKLNVRLHRGLYLDEFRRKDVVVLVKVAGCLGFHITDPPGFMMSFEGKVNDKGVLRFRSEKGGQGEYSWVSKRSPPVHVPPNVRYAYLYVVEKGKESLPQERKVLGRMRLSFRPTSSEWEEINFDQSISHSATSSSQRPSFLPTTSAGCILGAAWFEASRVNKVRVWADTVQICRIAFEFESKGVKTFGSKAGGHYKTPWVLQNGEYLTKLKVRCSTCFHGCRFVTSTGRTSEWYGALPEPTDVPEQELQAEDGFHITGLDSREGVLGPLPAGIDQAVIDNEHTFVGAATKSLAPKIKSPAPDVEDLDEDYGAVGGVSSIAGRRSPRGSEKLFSAMCCRAAPEQPLEVINVEDATSSFQLEDKQGNVLLETDSGKVLPDDKTTYFCHIDLLAGRNLFPPSDCQTLLEKTTIKPFPQMLLQKQYRVRVEDNVLDVEQSTDPGVSQSRRLVVPLVLPTRAVEQSGAGSAARAHIEPPPPVLIEANVEGQGGQREQFAKALLRHRFGWWQRDLEHGAAALNLNLAHKPFWHMLESGHAEDFNSELAGGIAQVFREKPRLLLAVLYSRLQDEASSKTATATDRLGGRGMVLPLVGNGLQQEKFVIEVDILGIRQLSEVLRDTEWKLHVTTASLWHMDKPHQSRLTIDFLQAKDTRSPARDCVAPVREDPGEARNSRIEKAIKLLDAHCVLFRHDNSSSAQTPLGCSKEVEFTATVIPYLQPQSSKRRNSSRRGRSRVGLRSKKAPLKPTLEEAWMAASSSVGKFSRGHFGRGGSSSSASPAPPSVGAPPRASSSSRSRTPPGSAGASPEEEKEIPFVIFPEVLFHLRRAKAREPLAIQVAGQGDALSEFLGLSKAPGVPLKTGTLTMRIPLNIELPSVSTVNPLSEAFLNPESPLVQAERRLLGLSNQGHPAVGKDLRFCGNIKDAKDDHDYVDMFVDVFAAHDGLLTWHHDFQMGRGLRHQSLFSIKPEYDIAADTEARAKAIAGDLKDAGEAMSVMAGNNFRLTNSMIRKQGLLRPPQAVEMGMERADTDSSVSSVFSDEEYGSITQFFNFAAELGCPRTEPLHSRLTPTLTCSQVFNPEERHRKYSSTEKEHRTYRSSMLDNPGGWTPAKARMEEYVEIDIHRTTSIRGVVIQGKSHGSPEYVTEFRVEAKAEGEHSKWRSVGTFQGNVNSHTKEHRHFSDPEQARWVRVYPQKWQNGICMRIGLVLGEEEHTRPLPPDLLFKEAIQAMPGKRMPEELKTAPTKVIKDTLGKHGFRAVTHLAAPEPYDSKRRTTPLSRESTGLAGNLHTYVREVGHVITKADRDSRFLARLRMCLPEAYLKQFGKSKSPEVEEALFKLEQESLNFLVIRFNKPGTVIWAPPLHARGPWTSPGEVMFAVQLNDGSNEVVLVRTPNFDIRFPNETSWSVRKTCNKRWRSIEDHISMMAEAQSKGHADKPSSSTKPPVPGLPDPKGGKQAAKGARSPHRHHNEEEISDDENDTKNKKVADDGYNRPFHITKNAFVCRLRKQGLAAYDRAQSINWWREVHNGVGVQDSNMEPRDLDIAASTEADITQVKKLALSKLMNLSARLPLLDHTLDGKAAVLKGHIRVRRSGDPSAKTSRLAGPGSSVFDIEDDNRHKSSSSRAGPPGSGTGLQLEDDSRDAPGSARNASEGASEIARDVDRVYGGESEDAAESRTRLAIQGSKTLSAFCPVENLWVRHTVRLSIYVLSVEGLDDLTTGIFRSIRRPYMVVSIDNKEQESRKLDQDMFHKVDGSGALNFYCWFTVSVSLPGPSILKLQVRDDNGQPGILHKTKVLGEATIDVEDRWLSMVNLDLARSTKEDILDREVMPKQEMELPKMLEPKWPADPRKLRPQRRWRWLPSSDLKDGPLAEGTSARSLDSAASARASTGDPDIVNSRRPPIKPAMRPSGRSPLESRVLHVRDPRTGMRKNFGTLRYFMDVMPMNEQPKAPELEPKTFKFHVRVKIQDVRDISVFRDFGHRNDVKVEGNMIVEELKGERHSHHRKTDVHNWAVNEASFNYEWNFTIIAPVLAASLYLKIVDVDAGGLRQNDIYKREVVALDHLVNLAFRKQQRREDPVGEFLQEVVFGSLPADLALGAPEESDGCLCIDMSGASTPGEGCVDCWSVFWGGGPCKKMADKLMACLCFACRRRARQNLEAAKKGHREKKPKTPAKLRMSIDIIPATDGSDWVEEEVELGGQKGRIGLEEAVINPLGSIKRLIGPENTTLLCRLGVVILLGVLLVVVVLALTALVDFKTLWQ